MDRLRVGFIANASNIYNNEPVLDKNDDNYTGLRRAAVKSVLREMLPFLIRIRGHPNLLNRWAYTIPRTIPTTQALSSSLHKLRELINSTTPQGLQLLRKNRNNTHSLGDSRHDWSFLKEKRPHFRAYVPLSHETSYFRKIPTEVSLIMASPTDREENRGHDLDWIATIESLYTIFPLLESMPHKCI